MLAPSIMVPLLGLAFALAASCASSASLVVSTTSGTFSGVASGTPNSTDKWLGLPFAEPPVGSLRFKAPVPLLHASKSVVDAVQFGDACPQEPDPTLGAPMSEDCLKLNVGEPRFCEE